MNDFETNGGSLYGIIPAPILCCADISDFAKILYAQIAGLAQKDGYCWASNKYLGKLFGKHPITISRVLSELQKAAFIKIIQNENDNGSFSRAIYLLNLSEKSVKHSPKPDNKNANKDKQKRLGGQAKTLRPLSENAPALSYYINNKIEKENLYIGTSQKSEAQTTQNENVSQDFSSDISQEQTEPKKQKNTTIKKPSLNEIKEYISEMRYCVNAEAFFDYYESNGWKVGRSSMKDWKAAVRTWQRTEQTRKNKYAPMSKGELAERRIDEAAARWLANSNEQETIETQILD